MIHRFPASLPRTALAALTFSVGLVPALTPALHAQGLAPAVPVPSSDAASALPSQERYQMAANLVSEALTVAESNPPARLEALRDAAALLPRLSGAARDKLTSRWMSLALSSDLPRSARVQALSSFFDVAANQDPAWAYKIAWPLPDPSGRASGFLALSEHFYHISWDRSNEYAMLAQRAARQEENDLLRARALTFVAQSLAFVNPVERDSAVREASVEVRRLNNAGERDYLLTEVVSATAKFDLKLARRMAGDIGDARLKNVAQARVNLSEISQTTLSVETADRVQKLAAAAARYDLRALPILLQLPASPEVFKAIADALPPIYVSATPSISPTILERVWKFAESAAPSVSRDELQSRLARLMVLQDLWRGRAWGKRLAWKGGRVQVGAFLKEVIIYRQVALRVDPLQDLAQRNIQRAIVEARTLPPIGRVQALLLLAGQVLG